MSTEAQPNDRRIQIAQTRSPTRRNRSSRSTASWWWDRPPGRSCSRAGDAFSSWVPGALGLFLRSKLYPPSRRLRGNVTFGQNVVLRHPHKIRIGNDVIVDDHVLLDAKGSTTENRSRGRRLPGRNTILSSKNGYIHLEERANLGFNCEIFAADEVRVGKDVMLAAYVYLVGGDHMHDRVDIPVSQQGRIGLPIRIGDGSWLGAHAVVAGGVSVGEQAIIGAGAVVLESVPAYHTAAGVPAKTIRDQKKD
jgi:acetyltransferase-like isoleucine patch superfamily enzyme